MTLYDMLTPAQEALIEKAGYEIKTWRAREKCVQAKLVDRMLEDATAELLHVDLLD